MIIDDCKVIDMEDLGSGEFKMLVLPRGWHHEITVIGDYDGECFEIHGPGSAYIDAHDSCQPKVSVELLESYGASSAIVSYLNEHIAEYNESIVRG